MRVDKPIKQEQQGQGKTKYLQKFCDRWLELFNPWLARCEDDPNKPFCKACQTRLDCNRCHLQRHERTSKHARNLEILLSKGETAARQGLTIRQERSKYYHQRKILSIADKVLPPEEVCDPEEVTHEFLDDTEPDSGVCTSENFHFVQTEPTTSGNQFVNDKEMKQERMSADDPLPEKSEIKEPHAKITRANVRRDRIKMLMQIQKDKHDLMDSFKELIQDSFPTSSTKEKNPVDLFFESVSSSVKALSPKFIAEAKMRVSQLICELELRQLTENDANATGASNTATTVLLSSDQGAVGGTYIINQPARPVMHTSGIETAEIIAHHPHEEVHHYETLA